MQCFLVNKTKQKEASKQNWSNVSILQVTKSETNWRVEGTKMPRSRWDYFKFLDRETVLRRTALHLGCPKSTFSIGHKAVLKKGTGLSKNPLLEYKISFCNSFPPESLLFSTWTYPSLKEFWCLSLRCPAFQQQNIESILRSSLSNSTFCGCSKWGQPHSIAKLHLQYLPLVLVVHQMLSLISPHRP